MKILARLRWLLRARQFALAVAVAASLGCDDAEVRFGPPGGLRIRTDGAVGSAKACPLPAGASGAECPEWADSVFPTIFDSEKYRCSAKGCHSGTPSAGLALFPGDPDKSYESMKAYENFGRPYISDLEPAKAYLLCNLTDEPKFSLGTVMPKNAALIEETDLVLLGNWVACGMAKEGGTPVMGTGGAGGGS
ncbi:MAG: hypothetical protein EXR75_08510 [Myxococcales bacterium]|nr:hypothetical protein [Myxococcales bacterium]